MKKIFFGALVTLALSCGAFAQTYDVQNFNAHGPVTTNLATATTPDSAAIGSGFNIASQNDMYFGGSTTTGGRIAVNGITYNSGGATSASNTNRNYVGVVGQSHAANSDGGTNLTTDARGGFFGLNGIAYADPAATNLLGIVAQENDTYSQAGASFKYQTGLNIVGFNTVRGSVVDAAMMIGGSTANGPYGPHTGWKCGMCFTDFNGVDPMYSGSTLLGYVWVNNPATKRSITSGIDLSGFSISGAVIQSQAMSLSDNTLLLGVNGSNISAITAGSGAAAANLDLNAKGGGAVRIANTASTHVLVNTSTDDGTNTLQVNGSTKVTGAISATTTGTMPMYGTTGAAVNAPHMVSGSVSLSGGSATVTLSGSAVYSGTNGYVCTANDATAANPVSVQNQSGSSVRFVGTGSDAVTFLCAGN
ncbi:hypothetical protein [Cupriavidus sp. CuC1]|uniref:hypothetical protein n=1 Tax=Cupriavidus sp. CuC1 TaxID=3373131 RepID=UPI0037D94C85